LVCLFFSSTLPFTWYTLLAQGVSTGDILLFDIEGDGDALAFAFRDTLQRHGKSITCLNAFGYCFVSADGGGNIVVWQWESGSLAVQASFKGDGCVLNV
jgi:hypothetical protein